jgi:cytochrome P450
MSDRRECRRSVAPRQGHEPGTNADERELVGYVRAAVKGTVDPERFAAATALEGRGPSQFTFPSAETLECPYPFYAALRREAPVYQPPGQDVFLVSRWKDIVYTVEHPEVFSYARAPEASLGHLPQSTADGSPPASGCSLSSRSLAMCDGPEHRLKRSVALRLVSADRLRRCTPLIARTVHELIDGFADRGEVEFVSEFAAPLPVRVISTLLGVPRDEELFATMMAQAPSSAVRFLTEPERRLRAQANEQIHEYMRRLVLDRRSNPREDFLTELVQAHARIGAVPLDYLVTEATTLLFGGLVTTQHMLTNTMFLLVQHPQELARVLADPSLIRPMLDESLRVETPFHFTETVCRATTKLAGVTIPAGAAVYKVWASGNRDEHKFEDAEAFRIGRPGVAKDHLGFGRGAHRCLGAPLALLEGRIAFEILLARCRNIRFSVDKNDWGHVRVPSFRSFNQLHLEFEPAGP